MSATAMMLYYAGIGPGSQNFVQAQDLLASMRQAYSQVSNAEFVVSAAVRTTIDGPIYRHTKQVIITPEGKFRVLTVAQSGPALTISDGSRIIQTRAGAGGFRPSSFTLQRAVRAVGANLETICFFDFERQLSTDQGGNMHDSLLTVRERQFWDGRFWTVLCEVVVDSGMKIDYYIDPESAFIHRSLRSHVETGTMRSDHQIRDLKVNQSLPPRVFSASAAPSLDLPKVTL